MIQALLAWLIVTGYLLLALPLGVVVGRILSHHAPRELRVMLSALLWVFLPLLLAGAVLAVCSALVVRYNRRFERAVPVYRTQTYRECGTDTSWGPYA